MVSKVTRRRRIPWLWLAGGAASTLLWVNRKLFTVNDVTAGQSTAYPNLKPHVYPFPAGQVFAVAEATSKDIPRWRVTAVDRLGREMQAEAQTAVLGFVDDITIRVNPLREDSASEVVVRSRSRKGVGDLGENARRIRSYYQALDRRISNASAPQTVSAGIDHRVDDSALEPAPGTTRAAPQDTVRVLASESAPERTPETSEEVIQDSAGPFAGD
ncbi:MAG: DUF1499 domain-containing protein [Chloroflexi bacterium]|nr:DUF1499 domain-containing protein [Chloroflexota bacterium]